MNKLKIIFAAAACSLAFAAAAQDTNILKTEIGRFENRTGAVIVKGFGQIGAVEAGMAEISVRCKETTDTSSGRKLYGLAIEFKSNAFAPERIYVDDDEIDALLAGLNYLVKITYDATALPGFEASYTTKGGLEVLANSVRKEGGIQFSVQGNYSPRIPFSSMQMTQLYGLIGQARKNLDAIKSGK
jgi:hypothetical protein